MSSRPKTEPIKPQSSWRKCVRWLKMKADGDLSTDGDLAIGHISKTKTKKKSFCSLDRLKLTHDSYFRNKAHSQTNQYFNGWLIAKSQLHAQYARTHANVMNDRKTAHSFVSNDRHKYHTKSVRQFIRVRSYVQSLHGCTFTYYIRIAISKLLWGSLALAECVYVYAVENGSTTLISTSTRTTNF